MRRHFARWRLRPRGDPEGAPSATMSAQAAVAAHPLPNGFVLPTCYLFVYREYLHVMRNAKSLEVGEPRNAGGDRPVN